MSRARYRLVVDPVACDGAGVCAELFPEIKLPTEVSPPMELAPTLSIQIPIALPIPVAVPDASVPT